MKWVARSILIGVPAIALCWATIALRSTSVGGKHGLAIWPFHVHNALAFGVAFTIDLVALVTIAVLSVMLLFLLWDASEWGSKPTGGGW